MDREFFATLRDVARAAIGDALEGGLSTANKAGPTASFDPVTEADRSAERALRQRIETQFPDHSIWGEEYGWARRGAAVEWSLDPVDGTRALICGLPSWAVLVGLLSDGRHVAGMIDLPAIAETFVAIDGETLRNEVPVQTSGCRILAEARLSTTDPELFAEDERAAFRRVRDKARLVRYGLDAMAYARVADGGLDLVVESGLKKHDYDALVAVVEGAGGHIGDWAGGRNFAPGRVIAAASKALYDEAVALLAFA